MRTNDPMIVRDNSDEHRYEIEDGGSVAFLEYRRRPHEIILVHTDVPAPLQGRGFGGILAQHALDRARSDGVRALVLCPFVKKWLERHPEYNDIVTVARNSSTAD